MPKRTNEFQDLIELLEYQIAPEGATVSPSVLLRDARTGEDREVDILIEHVAGIHPIRIGIEVRAHKRPASSTWIEAISAKHRDLSIDKSIAVSKSGFYRPAIEKAKALKIDTLTLREASDIDWKSKIDSIPNVKIETFVVPYLTKATLVFMHESSRQAFANADLWNVRLFNAAGESRNTVKELIDSILSNKDFVSLAEQHTPANAGATLDSELRLEEGSFAEAADKARHLVRSVKIKAKCHMYSSDAKLEKGRYRDVAVALASGTQVGHDFQMVFYQESDTDLPMVGLQLKKEAKK